MRTDWTIRCAGCGRSWIVPGGDSVYECEAIESRPCPHCHAYTLGRVATPTVRRDRAVFRLPVRKAVAAKRQTA